MGWTFIAVFTAFVLGILAGVVLAKFPPVGLAPPVNSLTSGHLKPHSVEIEVLGASLEGEATRLRSETPSQAPAPEQVAP